MIREYEAIHKLCWLPMSSYVPSNRTYYFVTVLVPTFQSSGTKEEVELAYRLDGKWYYPYEGASWGGEFELFTLEGVVTAFANIKYLSPYKKGVYDDGNSQDSLRADKRRD